MQQEPSLTVLKNFLKKSTPSFIPCNLIQTSLDPSEYHLFYVQKHTVNQIAIPKNKIFSSSKPIEYNNIVQTVENTTLQPIKLQPISHFIVFVREEKELIAYSRENSITIINISNQYQLEERMSFESSVSSICFFNNNIFVGLQNGNCLRICPKEGPIIIGKANANIRFLFTLQNRLFGVTQNNHYFTVSSSNLSSLTLYEKCFLSSDDEECITCVQPLINYNRIIMTTSHGMLLVFNDKLEIECQVSIHLKWITALDVWEDRIATCSEDGYIHVLQYRDQTIHWIGSEQLHCNLPVGLQFLKSNSIVVTCYEQEDLFLFYF